MFSCLYAPGGVVGVTLFFMISGYFLIQREPTFKHIFKLTLECWYYGLFCVVCYFVLFFLGQDLSALSVKSMILENLRALVLPASGGTWWFTTAYIFLLILLPVLNPFLLKLNRRGFVLFLLFMWFVCSATELAAPFSSLQRAMFCYAIGAYVKLYISGKMSKKKYNVLYALAGWVSFSALYYWYSSLALQASTIRIDIILHLLDGFMVFSLGPFIAAQIFVLFSELHIGVVRWINILSATTLGIYLLHDSSIGRLIFWEKLLHVADVQYQSWLFPLWSMFSILIVFAIGSVLDLIRYCFLEPSAMKCMEKFFQKMKCQFEV